MGRRTFIFKNLLVLFMSILFSGPESHRLASATSASIVAKDLTLTPNEEIALNQLKTRVLPLLKVNYMKSSFYLIRWIRSRNLNVAQAETALLQHLRWRQQNNIDTILNESFSDVEIDFPYAMDTHDLQGEPVCTVDVYDWDLRRAILQGRTPRLMRYLYRFMEDAIQQIFEAQQNGTVITRFMVLANADGFNLIQHACSLCLPVWIQFVRTFEAQYPGFLDEMIVIEAPGTVNVVLDLVRPILSPETNNAIKIFGHSRDKWMPYLDARISRSERRTQYGGTKKD